MPKKKKKTPGRKPYKTQRIKGPNTPASKEQKSAADYAAKPSAAIMSGVIKYIKPDSKSQVFFVEKQKQIRLTYGLTHTEFRCKCNYKHCQATIVDQRLLEAYEKLRRRISTPMRIHSGYRCQRHNLDVGGDSLSQHILGRAIDINWKSAIDHSGLYPAEFEKMAYECGFTFLIKHNLSFYHLDIREN